MSHQLFCSICKKKYGKDDFSSKERQKTVDLVCLRHSTSSSYGQAAITHNPIRTYNGLTRLHFTTRCHLCKITLPKENGVYLIQYTDPTNPNASSNFFYCQNCHILSNEQISDTDTDSDTIKQATNETNKSNETNESSSNDFISEHDDIFDTTEDEEEDEKIHVSKNKKRKSYVLHETDEDDNENDTNKPKENNRDLPKSKRDKQIIHQLKKIQKIQNKMMQNLQKIQNLEMDILFKLNTHPN